MDRILLVLVLLAVGLLGSAAVSISGKLTEDVTIKCSHANAASNPKYFCKGECRREEDVLISTNDKKNASQGKYSIWDDGNTFYVTISNLIEDDSGKYLCGISRFGLDTYKKVFLSVIKGKDDVSETHSDEANDKYATRLNKFLYIGVGLTVVALAVALLIVFRNRNRGTTMFSGKVHNTACATPSGREQSTRRIAPPSLELHEREPYENGDTGDRSDRISSLSADRPRDISRDHTRAPQEQPTVLYSAVGFVQRIACSSKPCHTRVSNSTITGIPDESAVYCNVQTPR